MIISTGSPLTFRNNYLIIREIGGNEKGYYIFYMPKEVVLSNMFNKILKSEIYQKATELGAKIVRTCSVSKWETTPLQPPDF